MTASSLVFLLALAFLACTIAALAAAMPATALVCAAGGLVVHYISHELEAYEGEEMDE